MEICNKIRKTFPNLALLTLAYELEAVLKDCRSVLDIGCGNNSPLRLINNKNKYFVGVDIYYPREKRKIHHRYIQADASDINKHFKPKSFDAVVALDLIEHLPKKQGINLIEKMENIAKRKIVILTPNGFVKQTADDNSFQEHVSGWEIKDFARKGFFVRGIYGLKFLRKERAELKFKPKIISGIISEISHYVLTKYFPKYSYSLIAFKEIYDKWNYKK
jgi:SAM-dependent methyltransferase